jgi:hypothetical protein
LNNIRALSSEESRPDHTQLAIERCNLQAQLLAARGTFIKEVKHLLLAGGIVGVGVVWNFVFTPQFVPLLGFLLPGAGLVYILFRVVDAWRQLRFSRRALRMFDRILSDIMS